MMIALGGLVLVAAIAAGLTCATFAGGGDPFDFWQDHET